MGPMNRKRSIPLALKLGYTLFMAVLVPVYWAKYGPTNFLYFCDLALFITLAAVWLESPFLASMAAVGIILPQMLWCLDFGAQFLGFKVTGMTDYMFDSNKSLFLRGLSLFHGWLPFLLLYLVIKLGYHRRGLIAWTATAWVAILVSYFLMPAPGAQLANPLAPVNINYVYGLQDAVAQQWMPPAAWLLLMIFGLPILIFIPTHLLLDRWFGKTRRAAAQVGLNQSTQPKDCVTT